MSSRNEVNTILNIRLYYVLQTKSIVTKIIGYAYITMLESKLLGKSTLTDLNNTELVLVQSRLAVSQAIYNYLNAKASLEQTVGYDFLDENGKTDLGKKEK